MRNYDEVATCHYSALYVLGPDRTTEEVGHAWSCYLYMWLEFMCGDPHTRLVLASQLGETGIFLIRL